MFEEGPPLDEYIAALTALRAKHGGSIRVQRYTIAKGRSGAPLPSLAFTRRHDCKRLNEHKTPQFYNPREDTPAQQGDPVIRV